MAESVVATKLNPQFKYEITRYPGGENLKHCFACGTCTASCPIAEIDEEYNPRKIIHMALLGMKERVLSSPLIWQCAMCYTCFALCPQNVKMTDIMNVLRTMAVEEGYVDRSFKKNVDLIDEISQAMRLEMVKTFFEKKDLDLQSLQNSIKKKFEELKEKTKK